MPFDDKKPKEMIDNQLKHHLDFSKKKPSIKAQNLIKHMLHPKQQYRATIKEIISSQWLKNCR